MDDRTDSLRAEAVPRETLTNDQREAGQHLARVLRDMAQAKSTAGQVSAQHPYLPRIDLDRPNHVALIDGKRGSGKSTLLLTLLQRYAVALLRERDAGVSRVPNVGSGKETAAVPSAERWVEPEDYVVPVGIVDLEPLSSSTNLLFQLLSHLERVVVAMEGSHGPGESGHKGELRSRQKWREVARRIAGSWDGNIAERKAMLDPKDYAIEREDDELRRRNLFQNFTEFLDTLAAEYKAWHPSPAGGDRLPFFLLSVDDADMSPKTFELLEIVRKFWHPRLGYLMTGDSHLFRERIRRAIKEGLGTESPPDTLAEEIYDKIVPRAQRGQLRPLEPAERLRILPQLRKVFESIPLAGWRMSLAEYFELNEQAQEILPERPRGLWDLEASIREGFKQNAPPVLSLSQFVYQLWLRSAEGLSVAERERIEPLVALDASSGRLIIEGANLRGGTVWRRLGALKTADERLSVKVGYPRGFGALFVPARNEWDEEELIQQQSNDLRQVMGALMLAVDVTWHDSSRRPVLFAPDGVGRRVFVLTEWTQTADAQVNFPWPFPEWRNYVDTLQLAKRFVGAVREIGEPWTSESVARAFLSSVIEQSLNRPILVPSKLMSWPEICGLLGELVQYRQSESRRARVNAEWALSRAPLLAAPESGLPAEVANSFLLNFKKTLGAETWNEARSHIERQRVERVKLPPAVGGVLHPSVHQILQTIDEEFLGYRFRETLEESAADAGARRDEAERLVRELDRFKAPFSARLPKPNKDQENLFQYFQGLRVDLLGQASRKLLERIRRELLPYREIRGATADLLRRFWALLTEGYNLQELSPLVRVKDSRVYIDESLTQRVARTPAPQREKLASLTARGGRVLEIFRATWASLPLLPELPNPVDALLRAILDYVSDEQDAALMQAAWFASGWYGSEVRFNDRPGVRVWPMVDWPALFEAERLESGWAQVAQVVAPISREIGVDSQAHYVDALAYWFVNAENSLMQYRYEPGKSIDIELTSEKWGELVERCLAAHLHSKSVGPKKNARTKAYARWVASLPQMAMPEAGLTQESAQALLAALTKHGFRGETYADLRGKLLREVPIDLRREIEDRFSGHPWFDWAKKRSK